jgi:hypothetical protein
VHALVQSQFTIDKDAMPVKDAFSDLLKKGQRQMRYKLKKQYFNGIPANAVRTTSPLSTMTDMQWKQLVDMWSNPKHKVPFLNIYHNCWLTEYMDCLSTNICLSIGKMSEKQRQS